MPIQPTVGRVVWYHPHDLDGDLAEHSRHRRGEPFAAIVVHVWSDVGVNLCVFDPNGRTHSRTSVPLWQGEGERPDGSSYAEWMPYQLGQAAKVAPAPIAVPVAQDAPPPGAAQTVTETPAPAAALAAAEWEGLPPAPAVDPANLTDGTTTTVTVAGVEPAVSADEAARQAFNAANAAAGGTLGPMAPAQPAEPPPVA